MSMTFHEMTKQRLATYKREVLNIEEDGIWRRNGKPYPHILPVLDQRLNILAAFREQFWDWFRGRDIRLHRDFHHLNSSQALCFNLFFPYVIRGVPGLTEILNVLGIAAAPVDGALFEFEPDSEEGTNFDFMIPLDNGSRIYFEVKFTESTFGSASQDDRHLWKFENIYRSRAEGRFEPKFRSPKGFLRHYQIVRNICHLELEQDDRAVFLLPRANRELVRSEETIRSCLLEPYRHKVMVVYLEDLVSALFANEEGSGGSRDVALSEFCVKYLPGAGDGPNLLLNSLS